MSTMTRGMSVRGKIAFLPPAHIKPQSNGPAVLIPQHSAGIGQITGPLCLHGLGGL